MPIVGLIGGILVMLVFTLSLPDIIAGIGLLKHRPWARILMIVVSVLNLINIPFGTLLGIYGLWVLLSWSAGPLFDATPAAAPLAPPTAPTAWRLTTVARSFRAGSGCSPAPGTQWQGPFRAAPSRPHRRRGGHIPVC